MLHILGAGSLGLLWAARCARAGLDCRLILRTPSALQDWRARADQLLLESTDTIEQLTVTAELAGSNAAPIRHLVVTTKAWAVADALRSVGPRLRPDSTILLLQNGLGSQQAACQDYPAQRVLYASVT